MNPTLLPALREILEQGGCDPKRYEQILTEIRIMGNALDDLQGFVDGIKPHVEAAAKMFGLKRS